MESAEVWSTIRIAGPVTSRHATALALWLARSADHPLEIDIDVNFDEPKERGGRQRIPSLPALIKVTALVEAQRARLRALRLVLNASETNITRAVSALQGPFPALARAELDILIRACTDSSATDAVAGIIAGAPIRAATVDYHGWIMFAYPHPDNPRARYDWASLTAFHTRRSGAGDIAPLLESCPNLRTLRAHVLAGSPDSRKIVTAPNLEHLYIYTYKLDVDRQSVPLFHRLTLPALKSLSIVLKNTKDEQDWWSGSGEDDSDDEDSDEDEDEDGKNAGAPRAPPVKTQRARSSADMYASITAMLERSGCALRSLTVGEHDSRRPLLETERGILDFVSHPSIQPGLQKLTLLSSVAGEKALLERLTVPPAGGAAPFLPQLEHLILSRWSGGVPATGWTAVLRSRTEAAEEGRVAALKSLYVLFEGAARERVDEEREVYLRADMREVDARFLHERSVVDLEDFRASLACQ